MSKDIALTADDGFPSDFTMKRVSESKRSPGKILAYHHILLGWLGPKSAYVVKLVAENAQFVIDKGYELNFKIMDMMKPEGNLLAGVPITIADIGFFISIKDYADGIYRANPENTTPEIEYAKLLLIASLPFGMVYIVAMGVFNITSKDWGKLLGGKPIEPIVPGTPIKYEDDPIQNILNWIFGLAGWFSPPKLPGPLQP